MGNEWPSGGEKTQGACPLVLGALLAVSVGTIMLARIVLRGRKWVS